MPPPPQPPGSASCPAAGWSVPAPPRISATVSRVISSRASLSSARASRSFNRAISPRSSSASWRAAASRRYNSSISEAIGYLVAPTRNRKRQPAPIPGQPESSQPSESLQKGYALGRSYPGVDAASPKGRPSPTPTRFLSWRVNTPPRQERPHDSASARGSAGRRTAGACGSHRLQQGE